MLVQKKKSDFNYNPIRRCIHSVEYFGMFQGFNFYPNSRANAAERKGFVHVFMNSVIKKYILSTC